MQMASNNWLYGCLRCYIQGSSDNVTMIGSYNCSAIGTSGVVIINSSGFVADPRHIGWTVNQGTRLLKNAWTTLSTANASALSPYTMSCDAGNKYKVDTTSGSVYVQLDAYELNGESINFKIINASNSLIISTSTNTEQLLILGGWVALPYTISIVLGENYVISSDGSNFHIL